MRELMPETWLKEEDEGKQTLSWPKRRTTPVTDILQWLQCYAAMVGVLSKARSRLDRSVELLYKRLNSVPVG